MDIKAVARQIAEMGEDEDKILAHINRDEAIALARAYGADINPKTGLPQFGLFSSIFKAIATPFVGATQLATQGLKGVTGALGLGGNTSGSTELSQAAQPYLQESNQLLKQYQSGNLTAADQSNLLAGEQAARSRANQYYAGAGLGDSSALTQAQGQIDINTAQARQSLLDNYLKQAQSLFGTAYAPLSQAVQLQYQQDQQNQSLIGGLIGNVLGNIALPGLGGAIGGAIGGSLGGNLINLGGGGSESTLFTPNDAGT